MRIAAFGTALLASFLLLGAGLGSPPIYNGTANLYATSSTTPLTTTAASGQTADIVDVLLFGGANVFNISSTGTATASAIIAGNLTDSALASGQCVTAGTAGILVGIACSTLGGVTSVTAGSGNITVSPNTGATVVDLAAAPTVTGTVTSSAATPFAMTGTGTNTITSASTGSSFGFTFNNTGSANTIATFQTAGVGEFSIQVNGAYGGSGTATAATINLNAGPTPISMLNTTSNTIKSSSTGATVPFALDASNASSPTGDLVDFQINLTNVARIARFGGMCPGNGSTNAAQNACIYTGAGVPAFSAANGSIYMDFSGVHGTNLIYVNTSGASTTGTTWTATTL